MSNGNGHRWSKWWWGDHRSDPALRMCCLAARGLWIEMQGLMFEAAGYLLVNGRQPSTRQLAALAGATEKEVGVLLAELEEAGVFSRTEDGTIYSRRMVRDAATTDQARAWGSKGGNPTLKPKPNGGVNPPLNPTHKAEPNPPLGDRVKPEAKKLEAESEEEPSRSPPAADAAGGSTPAAPGAPPTRTRANGTNPRATGTNPRNVGTNPRANRASSGDFVSGGIAVLAGRLLEIAADRRRSGDDLTEADSYYPNLKIVEGGRG